MAVVFVKEIWNGRAGSHDQKAVREYNRTFKVVTDNPITANISVRYATGIPHLFDHYVDPEGGVDVLATCRKVSEKQDSDNPYSWEVTAAYSTATDWPSLGGDSPTARPTEISWSNQKFQRPTQKDAAGNALKNSAGSLFDPAPQVDDSRPTLTMTRIESSFDGSRAMTYMDTVNLNTWMGGAPRTWKVDDISAQRQYEQNVFYWRVTYVFQYRPQTWDLVVWDAGYYALDSSTPPKRVRILDKTSHPSAKPQFLDGDGTALPSDGTPFELRFEVYKKLDFAALGLP